MSESEKLEELLQKAPKMVTEEQVALVAAALRPVFYPKGQTTEGLTEADLENQQRSIRLALYWLERRGENDAGPDFAIKTASDVLRNALAVKPGMQRAYLVAGFKLEGTPPVPIFKGVGIFSESEPTHLATMRLFVVYTEDDLTFDAAHKRLLSKIRSAPELAWVLPHLKERDLR